MIELKGVSVVFGGTLALDDVDLALGPGIVGLFGPNGSGKSTLLRTIAGLVRPARGDVLLDGRSVARAPESVRRRLGFAGHTGGLYGALSALENLTLFATLYGASDWRMHQVIEAVGIGAYSTVAVGNLSAGLQKRVALARALLHEPDVLLLDEPYANLDDEASDLVSEAIVRWKAPGRVAVIAGHGAKRIKSYADASVVLRRGRVASHRAAPSEGEAT